MHAAAVMIHRMPVEEGVLSPAMRCKLS
jgi:hypothetical protein